MLTTSYNGAPASKSPAAIGITTIRPVSGVSFNVASAVAPIFIFLCQQFHARVEAIPGPTLDDWGYNYRPNVNRPSTLSCHSSGTAIDINALQHPNGRRSTFNSAQVAQITDILAFLEGIVTWGNPGHAYGWQIGSNPDEMHFEITSWDLAKIARINAKVQPLIVAVDGVIPAAPATPAGNAGSAKISVQGVSVADVQAKVGVEADGIWGPVTEAAVVTWQAAHGLTADGWVGPATWDAMNPASAPPRLAWPFPPGHYVGDIKGPAASRGGHNAGSERDFVKNVQQWLIYRGAVPGVDPSTWATSGWADGRFEAPHSTQAARRWHDQHYPGQPYPEQVWPDDYARLTA